MAAHRYWRLYQLNYHGSSGQAGMSELELRAVAGGENLAITAGGTASASQTYVGTPQNVFDGSTAAGSVWSATVFPNWIKKDFGVGNEQKITSLTIKNFGYTDNVSTKDAILQWSDDDFTWTDFFAISNPGGSAVNTTYLYTPPNLAVAALFAPMAKATGFSGASSGVIAPSGVCTGYGGATAQICAPAATLTTWGGGHAALVGPSPLFVATGHYSFGENAFFGTGPTAVLDAYGGANAALVAPFQRLVITGTVAGLAVAALTAPAGLLDATAIASETASFSPFFGAPMGRLVAYGGALCSIATPAGTLLASGTTGAVGMATLTAPLFELTAGATAQNHGSASLLAPSGRMGVTAQAWLVAPGARLKAIGSAIVAVSYEAYSINLSHHDPEAADEVTRYNNFPFTHIVRYQNSYFGVAADGLYLLEGTTDDGVAIPYAVKTCTTDFDSPQKKTLVSAYLGARFGPTATVILYAGEKSPEVYSYNTPRDTKAQNHRQRFGRGIKERYLALGVSGTDALELDAIEFELATMTRRL